MNKDTIALSLIVGLMVAGILAYSAMLIPLGVTINFLQVLVLAGYVGTATP